MNTPDEHGGEVHYAELRALTNFSFLTGASHPSELVARAKELGYGALTIADECSLAGVVRAHVTAKEVGLKLLIGSQFRVQCSSPFTLVVIATNRHGYGNLCQFITDLRRASPKGTYSLKLDDIRPPALDACLVIACPERASSAEQVMKVAEWLLFSFIGRCWLGVEQLRQLDDAMWLHQLRLASEATEVPLVAVGDVHMHVRSRKALQDVLTAVRLGMPLTECGYALQVNAERHLRTRFRLSCTFPPELLQETVRVADRCTFSLDELRYCYPAEVVAEGETPSAYLRRLTYEGAGRRWPSGAPAKVQGLIEHELALIEELRYEHYFLTVADIVRFARSRDILCQGRGSAANSVVCYCLYVTEVDPSRMSVLFERFISRERNEPPDIDIDFENARREEVIQYLYERYGRHRAALTATVITYRSRSAFRDVAKALGFSIDEAAALAAENHWWDDPDAAPARFAQLGIDVQNLHMQQLLKLTAELRGFPRHLSQHTGGFVLTGEPLSRMVPIENAAMKDRTVLEFDKDDIEALGILKVDVLALGAMTAIRKTLEFISARKGYRFEMQDIPAECPEVYEMLSRGDSVGSFQVESRAQRSMLPRLKPRCFYDLVVEVALVRPGPIVGNAVHPYLERRQGKTPVTYPSEALKEALERTLGVVIFQEQVMQVAILAAGFTPGEADQLRRAMAAWRRKGGLEMYRDKLIGGMTERGYDMAFAQSIFSQVKGFAEYGFPESHAASFALLVYVTSWLKRHHPAEFLAGMLNSYPLGFYSEGQLIRDAFKHGVEVRPPDVLYSDYDSTLEDIGTTPAVRLGLRLIKGMREAAAQSIVAARQDAPFTSAEDLSLRARLDQPVLKLLAGGDALISLSGHRRQQSWDAAGLRLPPALLRDAPIEEDFLELDAAPEAQEVVHDYSSVGFTLRSHPMALLREKLKGLKLGLIPSGRLQRMRNGQTVRTCGIVTLRQQPETAKGAMFVSLEDEEGEIQLVVWKSLRDDLAQERILLTSRLLAVEGTWQSRDGVTSLVVKKVRDLTQMLGRLAESAPSRDFR
jgi:error-prone DNA polymerase